MTTINDQQSDYLKYRGKCKEMSEELCKADSTLRLVRGHYTCPIWRSREPHWWTEKPDGTVVDPTKNQFPSKGSGFYEEFDGNCVCSECGKDIREEDALTASNYAFCSGLCYGRFVGVY